MNQLLGGLLTRKTTTVILAAGALGVLTFWLFKGRGTKQITKVSLKLKKYYLI
jgi:hypothetical protein